MILADLASVIVNLVTSTALAWLIFLRKRQLIHYCLFNLSIAIWSSLYFFWLLAADRAVFLLIAKLLMVSIVYIPYAFLNFCYEFTKYKKPTLITLYNTVGFFLLSALAFTPLLVNGADPILGFHFWPHAGSAFFIFLAYFFSNVGIGLFLFIKKYSLDSNRVLYLFLASIIGFSGGSSNFFLWFGIPIFPYGNVLVSVYVLLIFYAITIHKLMDISVVIKKATAYAISVVVIIATLAGAWVIGRSHPQWTILLFSALALFWAFATIPLKNLLITTARRAFVRGWYDPQTAILKVSGELGATIERQDIFNRLTHTLDEILEPVGVVVIGGHPRADGDPEPKTGWIPAGVYPRLRSGAGMTESLSGMTFVTLIDTLPPDQQQGLIAILPPEYHKKSVVLPLFSAGKHLEGVIVLGPKDSGSPYTPTDLAFLATVQQFAEVVFEKIKPYEAVKAEYEHTKSQLQKMAEQAAFANLTMGIAHEIRNPFGILQTSINILIKKRDDPAMVQTMSDRIQAAIQRILKIMDHMTVYGRADHADMRSENVKHIIEDYLFTAKPHYAADGITLTESLSEVPSIKANASAIYQMIGNVVQNAAEAIQGTHQPGNITIKVATQDRQLDGKTRKGIAVTVSDDGPGMSEETRQNVFNAFFSTKHTHTGLGLSIVLNLMNSHGGFVDVESKEGAGTTIRLWFPI